MEAERESLLGEIDWLYEDSFEEREERQHRPLLQMPCGCATDGSRCLLHEELIDVETRRRFAFKERFRVGFEIFI